MKIAVLYMYMYIVKIHVAFLFWWFKEILFFLQQQDPESEIPITTPIDDTNPHRQSDNFNQQLHTESLFASLSLIMETNLGIENFKPEELPPELHQQNISSDVTCDHYHYYVSI